VQNLGSLLSMCSELRTRPPHRVRPPPRPSPVLVLSGVQNLGSLLSIVPNCESVKFVIFMDDGRQSPSDEHMRLAGAAGKDCRE